MTRASKLPSAARPLAEHYISARQSPKPLRGAPRPLRGATRINRHIDPTKEKKTDKKLINERAPSATFQL